jgi:F0F1-type ATP synthase delta subunit
MLPKLEGYAAARLSSLDAALASVVVELASLEQTVLGRADLRAVLTDTSIAAASRGLILQDLLDGKVHDVTRQVAVYAASHAPAQEVPHALGELALAARELSQSGTFPLGGLGLMAARQRVAGFADAHLDDVDAQNFDEIEDELFRWARTVEGNLELRRLLLDRDAELESRLGTVRALLAGKVDDVTLALATFVIEGGRPRDVVGTWTTWWTTSPPPATGASRACTRRVRWTRRAALTSSRRSPRSPARTWNSRSPTVPNCWAASSSRSGTCVWTPPPAADSAPCATPSHRATCTNRL